MHAWPVFERLSDLCVSPWAAYWEAVYGELPNSVADYPLSPFDFHVINMTAFAAANLSSLAPPLVWPTRVQNGSDPLGGGGFTWRDGELYEKVSGWHASYYDTAEGGGYAIYHSARVYAQNDTWIEVQHADGGLGVTSEHSGMWLSFAPGSGIWYNTGRHRIFDNHHEAMVALCGHPFDRQQHVQPVYRDDTMVDCARRHGDLDSFSFRTSVRVPANFGAWIAAGHPPCHATTSPAAFSTWGMVGLYELVAVNKTGMYACGDAIGGVGSGFRAGWRASRPCDCVNDHMRDLSDWANPRGTYGQHWLNCAGSGSWPREDTSTAPSALSWTPSSMIVCAVMGGTLILAALTGTCWWLRHRSCSRAATAGRSHGAFKMRKAAAEAALSEDPARTEVAKAVASAWELNDAAREAQVVMEMKHSDLESVRNEE